MVMSGKLDDTDRKKRSLGDNFKEFLKPGRAGVLATGVSVIRVCQRWGIQGPKGEKSVLINVARTPSQEAP